MTIISEKKHENWNNWNISLTTEAFLVLWILHEGDIEMVIGDIYKYFLSSLCLSLEHKQELRFSRFECKFIQLLLLWEYLK